LKKLRFLGLLQLLLVFAGCGDAGDRGSEPSYMEHKMWYMGFKAGLTESSTDGQFDNALDEVSGEFFANIPSSNQGFYGGILYKSADYEGITGKVPDHVWDAFWDDLKRFVNSNNLVGSCYLFNYVEIPKIGETGTVHVLYTIIVNQNSGIRYYAVKGALVPAKAIKASLLNLFHKTPQLDEKKLVLSK